MCNLLGEWLCILRAGTKRGAAQLDADADDADADHDDKKRRRVDGARIASSSSTTTTTAQQQRDGQDESKSAAAAVVEAHLKSLITQRFDPKKADTIWGQKVWRTCFFVHSFHASPIQAAPLWLEFMISQYGWRSLLYRLSTDHKDCLMLNFAIQVCTVCFFSCLKAHAQRISDAGHQSEIASLATASTYFSVFNRCACVRRVHFP